MGSCTGCGAKFSLFKRKMTCPPCQRYFCAGCTTKSRFNTDVCCSCRVFLSQPLIRNDVKHLKIKDLQHFLNLRRISHENIIEKEDLVNLVMVTIQGQIFNYDSSQESSNSGFNNPNYDLLVDNDLTTRFDLNPHTSSNSPTPDLPMEEEDIVVSSDVSNFEEYPCPELTRRGNQPPHFVSVHADDPENHSDIVGSSNDAPSNDLLADGPIILSQIQAESHLFQLSVRQLREILTTNRVDYRGMIEKSELSEKVVRLWNEIRSAKDADNLPDEELCKICMNAPVNCVILECGHMVSCVECGRQLAECPICRQFVVRVVRTFKA